MEEIKYNENLIKDIWFENLDIKQSLIDMYQIIRKTQRNDFEFLVALYKFYQLGDMSQFEYLIYCRYVLSDGKINGKDYLNIFEIMEYCFGLSRKTVQRMLQVCEKFICRDVATAYEYRLPLFYNYTISKLCELTSLSIDQILKAYEQQKITEYSTVKELREYVKSLKNISLDNKVFEEPQEEIPSVDFFNPENLYDETFFKKLSHEKLCICCVRLQDYVTDLRKQIKDLKKKNKSVGA